MTTEYGEITYLMGTAAADKAVALDLISMMACIALGGVALRLVQLWREDRRRAAKRRERRERQATAAIRRDCTGDPNSCTRAYSVPTDRETPICEVLGGECERTRIAREGVR